jgi:uncharacterized protein (UPF0333 family)
MQCTAQLSLEYLILLAAALSAFAVLLPILNQTYEASLFAIDCANAKSFANGLQNSIQEISIQAEGASKTIEANPLGQWHLSSNEEELTIKVQGPNNASKTFLVHFPGKQPSPILLSGPTRLRLSKKSGRILLEHSNP